MSDADMVVVYRRKGDRHPDEITIDNIYDTGYGDILRLFDPKDPPPPMYAEVGAKDLALSLDQANALWDRLGKLLGK